MGVWTTALVLAGGLLILLPDSAGDRFRTVVRDLCQPGQRLAVHASDSLAGWLTHMAAHELAEARRQVSQTEQTVTLLRQQLQHSQSRRLEEADQARRPSPRLTAEVEGEHFPRLILTELIDAAVVGKELLSSERGHRLLAVGRSQQIREGAWVLETKLPLLDVGTDARVTAADPVLDGRCIVGKIQRVGHSTSALLPISDAAYRGRARLVRFSDVQTIPGAEGLLCGAGQHKCQLTGIDSSESVRVGDEVYSIPSDGVVETPFYYGRVTKAEASGNQKTWQIEVTPAVDGFALKQVQVLRMRVNPQRLPEADQQAGHPPESTATLAKTDHSEGTR